MASLDKYFDNQPPVADPPSLRALKSARSDPNVRRIGVEISRARDGLTTLEPRLKVIYYGGGSHEVRPPLTLPWEPELEDWLIDDQRARATSGQNEKERFSLLLKVAMRPGIVRFGDGYFNSVLVTYLANGPFRDHAEVADVMRSIHEYPPSGDSKSDCEALIEKALFSAAHRLNVLYPNDRKRAEDILGGSVARYLDDRFSVTNRRLLGFTA